MAKDTSSHSDIGKMKVESDGSFNRKAASFRDVISEDGKFAPEKERYHLYVSYACPWATRCLIVRQLKGLEEVIPVTVVSPHMGSDGWPFASADSFPGAEEDPLHGSRHIRDLYLRAKPDFEGRFTVPVLWDKKLNTIVSNESSEIIRMFNTAFNALIPKDKASIDLYPEHLRKEIDEINEFVYPNLNNGVYRSGFAQSQGAYDAAVKDVFNCLDKLEERLKGNDYLVGGQLTEADIRLFVTTIRFDPVYVSHFKCNLRDIRHGYPAINQFTKNLYWNNASFKDNTNFEHIKVHYYWSQTNVNPSRVVAVGPHPDIEPL